MYFETVKTDIAFCARGVRRNEEKNDRKQSDYFRRVVVIFSRKEMRSGEMSKENKVKEEGNFMVKVATFIVDRRNLFFLLFGIAIIFSMVAMNWVEVENDLSAFLP